MKNKNTTTTNTTKKMWKWKENMQNRRQQHILSYQIEKKLERSCLFCYGKLETSPSSVLANNIRNMCGIACDRQTNFRPIEWVTGWGGMRTGEVSAYIHIHTSWSPSCPSFNSKLILCALPHYSHRSFFFTSFFAGAAAFASFGEWRNANKCTFIWIRFYWPASERYNNNLIMKSIPRCGTWKPNWRRIQRISVVTICCPSITEKTYHRPPPAISLRVLYIPNIYIGEWSVSAHQRRCVVLVPAFHERWERERSTNGQCDHMQRP